MNNVRKQPPRLLLILTATIDPGGMIRTLRADPKVRMADYAMALDAWLGSNGDGFVTTVVVTENSGADLTNLYQIVENHDAWTRVQFIQTHDNCESLRFGKGHGESRMLERLCKEARGVLYEHDYVVKLSGRLFVPNLRRCLRTLQFNPDYVSMRIGISGGKPFVDSRLFATRPERFAELFDGFSDKVDDARGVYFEHVLASRLLDGIREGKMWLPVFDLPQFVGVSASTGVRYGGDLSLQRYRVRRVLYRALSYCLAGRVLVHRWRVGHGL